MCGIAGIIGKFQDRLPVMLDAQKHRGPDATGFFYDEGFAALGHNRLSIIDLSSNANQPFFDASNRYAIVFNGEIYNYIELRELLSGVYDFKTESDTEVLLAAYIHWGKDCLSKCNGMFAFAVWDQTDKSLFAARDRFGVKPFHYTIAADGFYFASEIKAIHAAGIEKVPNEKVWASYFAYGSYGKPDETFWENVQQLPGGHHLELNNGELEIAKWYFFENELKKQPKNLSHDEARNHYLALLKDSIKLRFRADVPIGFNLSGGLDSSVLLALVNDFDHGKSAINAYTFYTGDENYDEWPWVEMMLKDTTYPLTKVLLRPEDVEEFSQTIYFHQDEPFGGIPTLAYATIFAQASKDGVKVLLDGQGMDEQWAGYDYYSQAGDATIQGVKGSPYKINMLSGDFLNKAEKPVYDEPFEKALLNKEYRDIFYTKIPRALRFNDRISMAFSTELREPFLDYRLMEFAFSLPESYKIKAGVTKVMLREIAAEFLSENLVYAPKRPLQTPQREWLGNDLKNWVTSCIDKITGSIYARWFDVEALEKEWQHYQQGNMQSAFHIWQCISLFEMIQGLV
ncbi:asparagine synthase (glutamine-hydrolyzing) [Flavobacterium noncentrifugens]|uniref:asparagine synthase (glutamine-hydrolyzing) n=1 Tax=Flavobacterium noncentrifugens TaxID=1128970 RepID=A0A1G8VA96_9FLAO|nr:asparagine synthase (glutamine-hydrolyzing) [Flavobacterium noncentrifugens]SDJ62869.1 asparagine synthase (glutamine-hydrolysing) [Flavobacterium noncentrifugens]